MARLLLLALVVITIGARASNCPLYARLVRTGWQPVEGHGDIPRAWDVDGPHAYDRAFRNVLKTLDVTKYEGFIARWLKNRQDAGKPTHVLDLFGSGLFVENQALATSITGIRWEPYDRDKLPAGFPKDKVPPEILGDVMNPKTWDALDASMKARGIAKMDLVTMNPVGGWNKLGLGKDPEKNALAIGALVRNVEKRLSPDGHFYFGVDLSTQQVPGDLSKHEVLTQLAKDIESEGKYRLVLKPTLVGTTTFRLEGALVPK